MSISVPFPGGKYSMKNRVSECRAALTNVLVQTTIKTTIYRFIRKAHLFTCEEEQK